MIRHCEEVRRSNQYIRRQYFVAHNDIKHIDNET